MKICWMKMHIKIGKIFTFDTWKTEFEWNGNWTVNLLKQIRVCSYPVLNWCFFQCISNNCVPLITPSYLGPSWLWSYGNCLSPLTLWIWIPPQQGVLDATLCDKICQWLAAGWWFSPGTPVSSTNKTDRHHIT
jgi:hypothetical protein